MEIRAVEGWDGYFVCDNGDVIGKLGLKRKTTSDKDGYKRVVLQCNGIRRMPFVHRLVAKAFIDNPKNLPTVNHKDGNKTNNTVDNLEWMSFSDNVKHSHATGLQDCVGEGNPSAKLTEVDVFAILEMFYFEKLKHSKIAEKFGVTRTLIYKITRGDLWKYIYSEYCKQRLGILPT